MTTTAIPSTNVDDFKANIQDFDAMANGTGVYTDRFGKERLTLDAFMAANGFEVPVAFASGIAVSRTTQTVTYNGNTYHALPSALPFTTTGTFNSAQWVLLRQNADNVTSATLTITGFTASALLDGAWIHFAGRDTVGDGGGGMFRYSASSTATPNGGTVIAPAGGGRLFREGTTITAQDFGAKGDGVTDDTAALAAMFATGMPWVIPYASSGYLVSATLLPKASGTCEGFLKAATGFADVVVDITGLGYQPNTKITGLDVRPASVRTAGSFGIRVSSPSIVLDRCKASEFDYGIQVRSYSVALMNCNANLCNTNLSAYAPSSTSEINDFKVIGGNYDSAIQYSCRIGDPRFSTTVAAGELMGASVLVMGAAFDGATSTFDRVFSLSLKSSYWEGPTGGKAIELGGSGDGWMRNVEIDGCYFNGVSYPIYCNSAINGLDVGANYYGGTVKSALYMTNSNLYGFSYKRGVFTNPPLGAEVHTGYGSVPLGSVNFASMTNSSDYLVDGNQVALTTTTVGNWYPYGKTIRGDINVAGTAGRYKTYPASGIGGVFAGTTFTCNTLSDAYSFNGGDRITASSGGFSYVRSVNYDTGVLALDGGTSAAGGGSISQVAPIFNGTTWDVELVPTTSGSITLFPAYNAGYYTRVGNRVTVQGQVQVQAVSSPLGSAVKLTLPLPIADNPELSGRFGGVLNYKNTAVTFYAEEGDSLIYVNIDASLVAASDNFYFTFSYVTA